MSVGRRKPGAFSSLAVCVVLSAALACTAAGASVIASWVFHTQQKIDANPVLDTTGALYVGSEDGNFYALGQANASKLWDHGVTMGVTSSAAIYKGSAGKYVMIGLGVSLMALDPSNGNAIWTMPTQDWVVAPPVVVAEYDTIYVGSNDYSMYAVAANGSQLWKFATGGQIHAGAAVDVATGTLVFGSTDTYTYGVDAKNGSQLWKFEAADQFESTPAIANATVYIGCGDGNVYALDVHTGTLKWRYVTGNGIYTSPVVKSDGSVVYATSSDNNLYAINALNGRVIRSFLSGDGVYSSPTLTSSEAYIAFGSNDQSVYMVDTATGKSVWSYETQGQIFSQPAIVESGSGGAVFIGSNDGNLYALKYAVA